MYYILTILAFIALELLYFAIAKKFNIVDRPNERSSHTKPVLLGGGVLFYLALLFYSLTHQLAFPQSLLGASILAVVSYVDDLRGLPSGLRFLAQLAALLLSFYVEISTLQIWQMVLLIVFFAGVLRCSLVLVVTCAVMGV